MTRAFTAQQVAMVQERMRLAAGKEPETFGVDQFVSMLSDEIDALRSIGKTDADIAALMSDATGHHHHPRRNRRTPRLPGGAWSG